MSEKKIRLFILILLSAVVSSAQSQLKKEDTEPMGYGIKMGVNIPTIGAQHSIYGGLAGISIGCFFNKPINQHFSWYLEPSFSTVAFRNTENDNRFNNSYFDAGAFIYYYPSAYNTDIALIGGVRPSYLLSSTSQVFEIGTYNNKKLAINQNAEGRIDGTAMLGVGVSLSPVINLELIYNHGLTNKNNENRVLGRSSTVDLNLRINAVALKKSIEGRNQSLEEQIQQYHKGVLLVMLVTPNEKEVKRLKDANKLEEVELLMNDIKQRNSKVIKEFSKSFSFAPVFFFMDSNIYKVISGNLNGIFVNANLQSDTSIKVQTDNYFIASFCEDISEYTKRRHYGLFVYDKQMNQLEKPFNHPNQLASPVFDYVVVNNKENRTRRQSYVTVPFDRLIGKFNTRLFRYIY